MAGEVPDLNELGHRPPREVTMRLKHEVARLLQRDSTNFPGAQPVSFARHHIKDNLQNQDYYVCEKSDGLRCLMYLTAERNQDQQEEQAVYMITRKNEYFYISDIYFPRVNDIKEFNRDCLIDGELVFSQNPVTGQQEIKYLMFDCLAAGFKLLLTDRSYDKRLAYLKSFIYEPFKRLCTDYPEDTTVFPFKVTMKHMDFSYGLQQVFDILQPKLGHISDGLIFTCRTSPYVSGTDRKILKWKPSEENSVDFLLTLNFNVVDDIVDYDTKPHCQLNVWYGGETNKPYADLYLTDSEWESLKQLQEPLDERVVECYKDPEGRWRYLRFRDDKSNGNHISTVESVLVSIEDPVTKEDLLEAVPIIRKNWKLRDQVKQQQQSANKRSAEGGSEQPRKR